MDVGAARSDGVAAGEEGDSSGILRAAASGGSRPHPSIMGAGEEEGGTEWGGA